MSDKKGEMREGVRKKERKNERMKERKKKESRARENYVTVTEES